MWSETLGTLWFSHKAKITRGAMLILDIFKTKMENPLINSDDCYSI